MRRPFRLKLIKDTGGKDLIEYALVLGLVASSVGLFMPGVVTSISAVIAKVDSALASSAEGGVSERPTERTANIVVSKPSAVSWWYRFIYRRKPNQESNVGER